eukprot:960611_1
MRFMYIYTTFKTVAWQMAMTPFQCVRICISFITLFFSNTLGYWLSQNRLKWLDASTYCQQRCDSHLASIHSLTDYYEAYYLIQNESAIMRGFDNVHIKHWRVWIGLNQPSNGSNWQWSDGSPFNFANDTMIQQAGQFPWTPNEPTLPNNEQCVDYNAQETGWNDNACDDQFRFLCNSCEGTLDKYILYTDPKTYSQSLSACRDNLNTSLASVHNSDDFMSTTLLVDTLTVHDAWIGLRRVNDTNEWRWLDHTEFDFGHNVSGGVFPWNFAEPNDAGGGNEDCVEHNHEILRWNDRRCVPDDHSNAFLCTKPSELSYANHWEVFNTIKFIANKRWNERNWPLLVEYTFAVQHVWNESARVGIFVLESENICESVFIGSPLGLSLESNRFYRLLFVMNRASTMVSCQVFLDDVLTSTFNFTSANHYRYIGIKNKNSNNIISKSLFISGTPQYDFGDTLYECTSEPTLNPSLVPSIATMTTTSIPTQVTAQPAHPTHNPSLNPTEYPIMMTIYPIRTSVDPDDAITTQADTLVVVLVIIIGIIVCIIVIVLVYVFCYFCVKTKMKKSIVEEKEIVRVASQSMVEWTQSNLAERTIQCNEPEIDVNDEGDTLAIAHGHPGENQNGEGENIAEVTIEGEENKNSNTHVTIGNKMEEDNVASDEFIVCGDDDDDTITKF